MSAPDGSPKSELVMAKLEAVHDTAQFSLPVDSEHKAKTIRIFSFAKPHMRAFHLTWFAFFMTFLATFAPASLITVIRDNIGADKWELGNAGVAAVCGAIAMRVCMGVLLDTVGPRVGTAFTVLMFSPAVFCMALVKDVTGFTAARLFIGCSLCMFVCCQFWVGTMFNVRIVGTANAIAAGWGNMGGGACAFIMPLLYEGIKHHVPGFEAWRWAFFVPGGIFLLVGIVTLLSGQDAPDGDYRDLKASGKMAKSGNAWTTLKCAFTNYRAWVLLLTYGYSFGVELTVDDMIVQYLYDQFELNLATAGGLGAMFGLMNIFSRASGGMISDLVAARFGMRGRLWALYIIQTCGGLFCIGMGLTDYTLGGTLACMVVFSIFCQQACGAHFGIAPFISRRAYGVVSGMIGAGGNTGAAITKVIFFVGSRSSPNLTSQEGLKWMGVMIIGMTSLLFTLWWPMWGSMLAKGNEDYAEEDYYLKEWTAEEVAQGLHGGAMKFAMESRSQRGYKANGGAAANVSSVHGSPAVKYAAPAAESVERDAPTMPQNRA